MFLLPKPRQPGAGLCRRWLSVFLAGAFTIAADSIHSKELEIDWSAADWSPATQSGLATDLKEAGNLPLETLAKGPDSCWTGPAWWVPNSDGETWDLVLFYYPEYMGPHHVTIIDFGSGEVRHQEIDKIDGVRFMYHLAESFFINGKLYVRPESSRVSVWEYDPDTNELNFRGFPVGEATKKGGWAVSAEGMIHGVGQESGGHRVAAYRFDPAGGDAKVFEPFGPENPNLAWVYSKVELDGDWLYVAVGNRPWRLLGYNFATGESRQLLETESIAGDHSTIQIQPAGDHGGYEVSISQRAGGNGGSESFWLHNGELSPRVNDLPPWSGGDRKFAAGIRGSRSLRAPEEVEVVRDPVDGDGNVRLWFRLKGASRQAADWADAGVRKGDWGQLTFATKFFPQPVRHMAVLPDKTMFTVTSGYGRAVIYDPAKDKSTILGPTMSVYSMCEHDGLIYMSGYPSSQIWIYDPAKPWTVGKADPTATAPGESTTDEAEATGDSNPRRVATLKEQSHVHMPFGGTHVAANGKVYVAGKVIRTGNGGGLGWWDPATDQTGGMSREFLHDQIFWTCLSSNDRYLICSTKPVADEADPTIKPERGSLFVFDTETERIVHQVDSDQWNVPGYVVEVAPGLVMGFGSSNGNTGGGVIYGLDVATGKILWTKPVLHAPVTGLSDIRRGRFSFELGPDGHVWTVMDRTLVRIDPSSAAVEPLGKLPGNEKVRFLDGRIYLSGAHEFRRIANLRFDGGDLKH